MRVKRVPDVKGTKRSYLCLVESYREAGKVKQRNVATLGRVDELKNSQTLKNMATKITEFVDRLELIDMAEDVMLEQSYEFGPIHLFRILWTRLGFGKILDTHFASRHTRFSISEAVFAMVCNRLMDPGSKRETNEWLDTVYEPKWKSLELHHLYRAMDYLAEEKERFEINLYDQTRDMFGLDVDLVMFDTTSIMSWSEGEHSELLKHGFSKEKRGDLKQIMVGVLMTKDGIPIAHEVWEGNQSDKKSFLAVMDKLKLRFKLDKIILVCDRGMISQANIDALTEAGYQYILGVPMRKLSAEKRKMLLGTDPVTPDSDERFKLVKATESGKLYVKDVRIEDQRFIVCYNPSEADYEARQRSYFKEILTNKAEFSSLKDWVVKNGYRKYISFESPNGGPVEAVVDTDRLEAEAIYDGKWVLTTNTSLTSEEIARYYKGLSQVEQAFRELKSNLEIGPMYHWTSKRIRSHVFICFLALVLKLSLKKSIKAFDPQLQYSAVLRDVRRVKVATLNVNSNALAIRSQVSGLASSAWKALNARIPDHILSKSIL